MPKTSAPPNRGVVALAYERLCAFEFGITAEVFGLPRPEMGADWYGFAACAERPDRLATNVGLAVQVDDDLDVLAEAGTIVVPGWRSEGEPPSDRLREALRAARAGHAWYRSAREPSCWRRRGCWTAVARRSTWRPYAERLQAAHPAILVDADTLCAGDDRIFTSAGSAAGIDLLLHLVRMGFGADAANNVARRMVVAAHRSEGRPNSSNVRSWPDRTAPSGGCSTGCEATRRNRGRSTGWRARPP